MPDLATSEQAISLVGYLQRAFGGYPLSDDDKLPYLRTFRHYEPSEISQAIDRLVRKADRRPSANEIAAEVRKRRPKVPARPSEPLPDVTPERVSAHVAAIKAEAKL